MPLNEAITFLCVHKVTAVKSETHILPTVVEYNYIKSPLSRGSRKEWLKMISYAI
jgi:hypothetical protein